MNELQVHLNFDISSPDIFSKAPLDRKEYSEETKNSLQTSNDTQMRSISLFPKVTKRQKVEDKSLGVWFFDVKRKKRTYRSLSGKILFGKSAVRQSRIDKECKLSPECFSRQELQHLVACTPHIPMDVLAFVRGLQNEDKKLSYLNLSNWGIPSSVLSQYSRNGVTHLFPWQLECITSENGAPLLGNNLIYSAPTSGGKTLVCELLMLRRLALVGNTILFVIPFVSLGEEKAGYFRDMWSSMNIGVVSFHGESYSSHITPDIDIAVCTIEKANSIFNECLQQGKESQISMIVIDEIHLLSDPRRGYLLEILLSKIKFVSKGSIQIVGMSATLPNIRDISQWIDGALYTTSYRPTNLTSYLCVDRHLYKIDEEVKRNFSHFQDFSSRVDLQVSNPDDIDGCYHLVIDTLANKKNVLVFCASKKKCEDLCLRLASAIYKNYVNKGTTLDRVINVDEMTIYLRTKLLGDLSLTPVGLCPILKKTILYGVSYHHSGLTIDERKLIEAAYKSKVISVLCTTSTLAAGVNLPANRVIIREPRMGHQDLSVVSFRQMCGRAGRMGLDDNGEAILIISSKYKDILLAESLFTKEIDQLRSALKEGFGGGIEKLLLDLICCGKLHNENQLSGLFHCTLLFSQNNQINATTILEDSVEFLKREQFIQISTKTELLPTPLGIATTLSGLPPKVALLVMPSLLQARSRLMIKGGLHPVFLVTPIPTSSSISIEPDWNQYEQIMNTLFAEQPDTIEAAQVIGIDIGQLIHFKQYPPSSRFNDITMMDSEVDRNQFFKVMLYKRFYLSIILYSLVQEWPITRVISLIGPSLGRGQIQQLQKEASAFCSMIVMFCQYLNWNLLGHCLSCFTSRLNFGVLEELVPLVRIGAEMSPIRAREFYRNGIRNPSDILERSKEDIVAMLMSSLPVSSRTLLGDSWRSDSLDDAETQFDRCIDACQQLALIIIDKAKKFVEENG